jgi:uncharacterized protein YbaA (DUF1428 family)
MAYVDGYVLPVPVKNREAYVQLAQLAAGVFRDCGATAVVETWGDDVPEGKLTSFTMAVKRQDDEAVVFSWVTWPDKATRDAGMKRFMDDPRMKACDPATMPFDGQRMIFGGFDVIVSA